MNHTSNLDTYDDEIDLREIFLLLLKKKLFIGLITFLFAISSILYSINLPNIYTSSAILAPANVDNSLSSKAGQLSGLASFSGINIGESGTKSEEAIERIKSYDFFSKYFLPNIKLENLMAVKEWDHKNDNVIYNENEYDPVKGIWIRDVSYPKKTIPSAQEAYEEKYKKILNINVNKNTGFVSLSIDHESPMVAKKWLDIIIFNINESMKSREKLHAENSIKYLNETSDSINIKSVRDVISNLLENQMQTLMIAYSSNDYVFKIIESPIAPEKKSAPARAIICILGTIIGGLISITIVLIQFFRNPKL